MFLAYFDIKPRFINQIILKCDQYIIFNEILRLLINRCKKICYKCSFNKAFISSLDVKSAGVLQKIIKIIIKFLIPTSFKTSRKISSFALTSISLQHNKSLIISMFSLRTAVCNTVL